MKYCHLFITFSVLANVMAQQYQSYKTGKWQYDYNVSQYVDTFTAQNEMACGRECSKRNCNFFYYSKTTGLCKRLFYNYIDMITDVDTEPYEFFYKSEVSLPSSLPWLICPSASSGNVVALRSTLEIAFMIHLDEMTQANATETCASAGGRLMKIDTVEKQTVVQHILNSCPDFVPLDFWIDGRRNKTQGWLYADGTSVPMNDAHLWVTGGPDYKPATVRCLRMRTEIDHRWDDKQCFKEYPFICEPLD